MGLNDIKSGDKVALYLPTILWSTHITKEKVDRVTRTQIIIGVERYRRSNGELVGGDRESSYIKAITPEVEQEIIDYQAKVKRRDLINKIKSADFNRISTETLREVVKILEVEE